MDRGGAAGPSVHGVRKEVPGVGGAVSVQAREESDEEVQLERKGSEGAHGRRAEGAVTSELTPPPLRTTTITTSHSSLFAFHCAHCGRINIVPKGHKEWRNHTLSFPHRYTRREGESSRGAAAAFQDRVLGVGWGAHVPTASEEPSRLRRYVIGHARSNWPCWSRLDVGHARTHTVSAH